MWTSTSRDHHRRRAARYQSDVTDAEWPDRATPTPAEETRRPWRRPMREVVNAIFYVLRSWCPWRQTPTDLVPWSTAYRWFAAGRDGCVFERINHALVMTDRQRPGRAASLQPPSSTAKASRPRRRAGHGGTMQARD